MIIGLCGPIGSGKSFLANRLVKELGFVRVAFADALKQHCADYATALCNGNNAEEHKKAFGWTGEDWTGPKSEDARRILCETGEHYRRLDEDHWLKLLAKQVESFEPSYNLNIVIDDPRYINELNWIIKQGGKVHCLSPRRDAAAWVETSPDFGNHPSECQWRAWAWNRRESEWTQQSVFESVKAAL